MHCTASYAASSNVRQCRPPSYVTSLPVGPTATAVARVRVQPVDAGAVAAEVAAVGPRPPALVRGTPTCPRRSSARRSRRRPPAPAGRCGTPARRHRPRPRAAGIVESCDRPGVAAVARSGRSGTRRRPRRGTRRGGRPSPGRCRWRRSRTRPSTASGMPAGSTTDHEAPPSVVSMIRNFPSTGSLIAIPRLPPGHIAMQS